MAAAPVEEQEGTLTFTAFLRDGPTSLPVVADFSYDKTLITLQGNPTQDASGAFVATFKSRPDLREGGYNSQIRFRLCAEAACNTVYPGSEHQLSYHVYVLLKDWATYQRDPAHTGYVRLNVDVPKITKLWDYAHTSVITKVAADRDRVYFGVANGAGGIPASIRALKISNGTVDWNYDLGAMSYIGDPAIAGGRLFLSSMVSSSSTNPITILDAATGSHRATGAFASQWSAFLAPVPAGEDIYTSAGYYGNVVYSHTQSNATLRWSANGSGGNVWHAEAPAVDNSRVYYYTGTSLDAFDRATGSRTFSIIDPYQTSSGYDYGAGPVILKDGSVLAFSGTTVSSNTFGPADSALRPLVRYMPETRNIAWRTLDAYRTQPATRDDLIFAARIGPSRLDAINVSDGRIAWSWAPPTSINFQGAVLVTDNIVFVSSDEKVYGISLTDHVPVWTYDKPGVLAVAPRNILLISEANPGTFYSNGRISAFMLRGG